MIDRDRFVDPGDATNAITLIEKEGDSLVKVTASLSLLPEVNAAKTIKAVNKDSGDLHLAALIDDLAEQNQAVNNGDMTRLESMLASQAHTLDALFNSLVQRGARNIGRNMEYAEKCLRLALRAQSQGRATVETLSVVKNPPIAGYVNQANISGGHQQVNNGCTDPGSQNQHRTITQCDTARASENKNQQTELLESNNGERLDFGTTAQTCDSDKALETVGTIDGS